MAITAPMVKELRERTGAGMMECKKALTAADGDMDAAIEQMRISGLAKADKRSDNTAAEGVINIKVAQDNSSYVMVEINSQSDFASKTDHFTDFTTLISDLLLSEKPADVDALNALPTASGQTVAETRTDLVANKIKENIQVRRFVVRDAGDSSVGAYSHGGRIGVVCEVAGGDADLAKDIAMHIAASRPLSISEDDISADLLEKEKAVFKGEAAESGKPAEIVEKMVQGKIRKYLADVTLLGQPFVKDSDVTVGELLKKSNAKVVFFQRYEVGEGIEKKVENFAEEVMAQVRGN